MAISKNLILVAALGGTIASAVQKTEEGSTVKLGDNRWTEEFFESVDKRHSYKIIAPAVYSSENATVRDYRHALSAIYQAADKNSVDGILILHGTDSMAYFAQLAVRTLSFMNKPCVITGSKLPPDQLGSDAVGNIKLALGFLSAACEGNTGSKTFGVVYNDSFTGYASFTAASEMQSADINGDYKPFVDVTADEVEKVFDGDSYREAALEFMKGKVGPNDRILVIPAVPNFPYASLRTREFDAVLIESYHSGTAESRELPEFVKSLTEQGKKCYMAPVPYKGNVYESRRILESAGVKVLSGISLEAAWSEILLGCPGDK